MQAITIHLDKERHAKNTLGGMYRFEQVTGKSLDKGLKKEDMDKGTIIALVWSLLIWEDSELTIDQVGFMLDSEAMEEATAVFSKIYPNKGGKEIVNPTNRPTG